MSSTEINITTGRLEDVRIAFIYNQKTHIIVFNTDNKYCEVLLDITKAYLEMTDSQLEAFKQGIEPKKELDEYLHMLDRIRQFEGKIQSHRA